MNQPEKLFTVRIQGIKMECWPRGVEVTLADAEQYEGWPVTIFFLGAFWVLSTYILEEDNISATLAVGQNTSGIKQMNHEKIIYYRM